MIESLDADTQGAVAHAAAMEAVLVDAGIALEHVHHGDGIASWAVSKRALRALPSVWRFVRAMRD